MEISSSCLSTAGTGADSRNIAVARITSSSPSSSGNCSGCIFDKLSNTDWSSLRILPFFVDQSLKRLMQLPSQTFWSADDATGDGSVLVLMFNC
jgi:hypothetical protein